MIIEAIDTETSQEIGTDREGNTEIREKEKEDTE